MPRKLKFILPATLAAVAALVSACSSSPSTPAGPAGGSSAAAAAPGASSPGAALTPATLRLAAISSNQPGLDKAIADWNKLHPDVKVQATYYPSDTYTTTLATQFSGGNGPDLVWLVAGHASPTSTQVFAKQGYLADLTSQPWVSTMYPTTKPLFTVNGRVYVRDMGLSPLAAVSYNKAYFTQHNLKVPQTFSEFLGACKTIASQGLTPVSWAGATPAINANDLAVLAGNLVFAADPTWLTAATSGQTSFSKTPGWKQAVQEIADMKSANCFSPGIASVNLTQMVADFAGSRTAMIFTYGGLDGNVLAQTPSMQIGMFAMPAPDAADTRLTLQAAGGLGINAKSPNQADAEALLNFLSTPAEQKLVSTTNNLISPADATAGQVSGIYADISSYFTGKKTLADPTAQWPNTSYNTNTGTDLQGLFTGQKTVAGVLADMDNFFNAKS